jgi:Rrf2 family protein
MKLSTRGRYGTRALLDLAIHQADEPVLLRDIAQRQQISLPYLEQLMAPLRAGGLIRSSRGIKGGISLAKPAPEITLCEVICLLEGPTAPVECVSNPAWCSRSEFCVTRDVWAELKTAIDGVLESTTLSDLVKRQQQKEPTEQPMYCI